MFNELLATLGIIGVAYGAAFIVGFIGRILMARYKKKNSSIVKNIGSKDRLMRAALGVTFLIAAAFFSWNPILLFVSGFCFFEALFSWCALFAWTDTSSCPL